ncbi:MAG: glycosyltransferase family 4 protein [Actinomycetota bacterium]
MTISLVHDYLTQRGGAERVVLSMIKAFPGAPLHTSLYEPRLTFPGFEAADIRPLPLNRVALFRRHHRAAFPLLAQAFSKLTVSGPTVLCSSSGWAHGVHAEGRKIVYCYTPARWIYQTDSYAGNRKAIKAGALVVRPALRRWDERAAASADVYIAISTAVRQRIQAHYGRDAELLAPPLTIDPGGPQDEIAGLAPGFILCVSRLLQYKNVDAVVEAFAGGHQHRLVVVGSGPEEPRLRAAAASNVKFLSAVSDDQLRWLYDNCRGVIAASYEDYGLTPLEGAAFGKPSAVLRWGGFLDTVVEDHTGIFFEQALPSMIRAAIDRLATETFDPQTLRLHAARSDEDHFVRRLREIVLGVGQDAQLVPGAPD